MNGTQSAEIVDELVPFAKIRVNKQYNDSFFRSKLDATLKKLGVTEIIIVGIQTNYCIRGTAEGGYYRGYSVNVISDCVTDEDEESHEIGLKTISSLSGTVINSDNFELEFDSYNF